MTCVLRLPIALILLLPCQSVLAQAPAAKTPPAPAKTRQLTIENKVWTGDFDKLLERRMIRVYAPFSRSLYYNDNGRERGRGSQHAAIRVRGAGGEGGKKLREYGLEGLPWLKGYGLSLPCRYCDCR